MCSVGQKEVEYWLWVRKYSKSPSGIPGLQELGTSTCAILESFGLEGNQNANSLNPRVRSVKLRAVRAAKQLSSTVEGRRKFPSCMVSLTVDFLYATSRVMKFFHGQHQPWKPRGAPLRSGTAHCICSLTSPERSTYWRSQTIFFFK